MSMNSTEMKNVARNATIAALRGALKEQAAVQFADASWAILQIVDDQEIWCEVTVKTKAYKPTKTAAAFDPYEAAEAWKEEKRIKAEEKAEKEAEKAKKVAKAKEQKEKEEE